MKTLIFYFTGTGNSLFIAKQLKEKIRDSEIDSLVNALNKNSSNLKGKICVVFPVYMFRPPHAVMKFLHALKINPAVKQIFLVITNGGNPGDIDSFLKRKLGLSLLKAIFFLEMIDNYIPFFEIKPENEQKEILSAAEKNLDFIADILNTNQSYFARSPAGFFQKYIFPGIIFKSFYPMIPKMDRSFWTTETCNACQICEKICPVNNIKMKDNKPEWLHKCEQCLACLHWCPQKSIQYGKSTVKKGRYHHPGIKLNEIMAQKE